MAVAWSYLNEPIHVLWYAGTARLLPAVALLEPAMHGCIKSEKYPWISLRNSFISSHFYLLYLPADFFSLLPKTIVLSLLRAFPIPSQPLNQRPELSGICSSTHSALRAVMMQGVQTFVWFTFPRKPFFFSMFKFCSFFFSVAGWAFGVVGYKRGFF